MLCYLFCSAAIIQGIKGMHFRKEKVLNDGKVASYMFGYFLIVRLRTCGALHVSSATIAGVLFSLFLSRIDQYLASYFRLLAAKSVRKVYDTFGRLICLQLVTFVAV